MGDGGGTEGTAVNRPVSAVPNSFGDLAARLVTRVPAGYEVQPDDIYNAGPYNLAMAVRDDGDDDADRILQASTTPAWTRC